MNEGGESTKIAQNNVDDDYHQDPCQEKLLRVVGKGGLNALGASRMG